MRILPENLKDKIILEVACGRGGTTEILAEEMSGHENGLLIVTDIDDRSFETIQEKISKFNVKTKYFKTDACSIEGIDEGSVDIIVCRFGLCSINSECGGAVKAVMKFSKLLKEGGQLIISDEPPILETENDAQEVWRDKWKILRLCNFHLNKENFKEISDKMWCDILDGIGFEIESVEKGKEFYPGRNALGFFEKRLAFILNEISDEKFIDYVKEQKRKLYKKNGAAGGMEIPSFTIKAKKKIK